MEQFDTNRLEALLVLTELRQVSLPILMQQLGIQPSPVCA